MKIIHTSDIHIASPLTTRLSPIKARERALEIIGSFRRITEDATAIGAEALIISGDLFDNDSVGISTLDSVMGIIESSPRINFLYLPGNHEKSRLISSGVRIPKNLMIFADNWTAYKIGDINFIGRAKTEKNMFDSLTLNENESNILVLHGELCDHSDEDGKIGLDKLNTLPIAYLALGHYHSFSETKLTSGASAVYSGTPEGRGFDEAGCKGYVIINANGGKISYEFKERAKRTLHICEIDITDAEREIEIERKIADKICGISQNDLVRVVLIGECSPTTRRDIGAINERFSSGFYFFEAKDKTTLRICSEDYKNDKSLKGEFIRLVLSKEELTQKQKEAIIECGLRALAGETI